VIRLLVFLVVLANDGAILREMLEVAGRDSAESPRRRLEALARSLQDPSIRTQALEALDAIAAAAEVHRKASVLAKEAVDLGGKATFERGGPAWMRDLAGDPPMEVFDRLVGVSLSGGVNAHAKDYKLNTRVTDDWTSRLSGFPELRVLNLENTDVRGPGLRPVGTLLSLESLNLTLCPVTDEPLGELSKLTQLKVLGLASTKVTGTGMKELQDLRKLENLNFHSCPVTDAGLEWIGKLSSLVRLEIVHTQFTDAGPPSLAPLVNLERLQLGSRKATGASLTVLRGLPKLQELDVHDGMLTPEGVRHVAAVQTLRVLRAYGGTGGDENLRTLSGHARLETLILENLGVTDAGIPHLAGLPRLRKLVLHEPKVSDGALVRLREALPSLEITR
jgi:hypothetical protein